MSLQLANFDAVTFDVYGTLIDWEPAIMAFLRRWADQNSVCAPDKDLLLAFDRTRAEIQKERPALSLSRGPAPMFRSDLRRLQRRRRQAGTGGIRHRAASVARLCG